MPMSGSCRSKYLCAALYSYTGGHRSQSSLAASVEGAPIADSVSINSRADDYAPPRRTSSSGERERF
jgi:hypothetical protein